MTLFGVFPPILRGFDAIKVICVRYNLDRPYYREIATVVSVTTSHDLTVVSVTISHDLTALPSSMNRQPPPGRYKLIRDKSRFIVSFVSVSFDSNDYKLLASFGIGLTLRKNRIMYGCSLTV
jgi:hypothetical protein